MGGWANERTSACHIHIKAKTWFMLRMLSSCSSMVLNINLHFQENLWLILQIKTDFLQRNLGELYHRMLTNFRRSI